MRALLLLLLSSNAWADQYVMASPRVRIQIPDDATPMASPPTSDSVDGVVGWTTHGATLLVQRKALDEPCEHWVADEEREEADGVKADAGASLKLAFTSTKTSMVASGTQKVDGRWTGIALFAGCVGPEAFVVSVRGGTSKAMTALATQVGTSLASYGTSPSTQRIAFGTHTIDVPAPATDKGQQAPGIEMFSVPGVTRLAVMPESYTGGCEAYLAQVLETYLADQKKQAPDANLLSVLVERTGDIVWRIAKQHATKGPHAGQWYANITASTCQPNIGAGSLLGLSFDEAGTKSELSPVVVARVRALLATAARTMR